ncbi:MAG TPA: YgiQ family radical SAM protein [Spirochaetales bacterium]|nr:YgiQ family radical SAM protein [Spirochaetales bacterium]
MILYLVSFLAELLSGTLYSKKDFLYTLAMPFLPTTQADLAKAAVQRLDFVILSGDAYVDHPSFGTALIARLLESRGYTIGIIARPDPDDVSVFRALGKPRLAFLITSGAMDSMVCKYTANKKLRSEDEYSPGGDPSLCRSADGTLHHYQKNGRKTSARPDRTIIAYCTKAREAFKGVPIIAGGIEASLRRLSHYDYLSDTVRRPIVLDAKADLVIYGMAERAVLETARRLADNPPEQVGYEQAIVSLRGIRGTVWRCSHVNDVPSTAIWLPSFEETAQDKQIFARSFALQYQNTDPGTAHVLVEQAGNQFAVQEPPQCPLTRNELDALYDLPYMRAWHPVYDTYGGVPAFHEVQFSITSNRGCFGACAFCSLAFHQGRIITSRSHESILKEARVLTRQKNFKGYIHDVGGPTANFRNPACVKQENGSACVDKRCLVPVPCKSLKTSHEDFILLLKKLRSLPGVKKVFIRSGIRFDYILAGNNEEFLQELALHHVSGQLKVAPEHVSDHVLALMGKPPHAVYEKFVERWKAINKTLGLKQFLIPYFIASLPGATLKDAVELAEYLRDSGFIPDQVQDFYPTPGTLATAMYYTGIDPLTGKPVYTAKGARERAMQRALLQYSHPENRQLVKEALTLAGREDLIGKGPRCLVS